MHHAIAWSPCLCKQRRPLPCDVRGSMLWCCNTGAAPDVAARGWAACGPGQAAQRGAGGRGRARARAGAGRTGLGAGPLLGCLNPVVRKPACLGTQEGRVGVGAQALPHDPGALRGDGQAHVPAGCPGTYALKRPRITTGKGDVTLSSVAGKPSIAEQISGTTALHIFACPS